mgnify:FL=1
MSTACVSCSKKVHTIYIEHGLPKCLDCSVNEARKRYWAQKPRDGADPYGSVTPGPCFLCDGPAQFGVLRELSRDGNSETCPTWVCWNCHLSIPTLFDFVNKSKPEGAEECE